MADTVNAPASKPSSDPAGGIALTFKIARERVELEIARFRVWFFASACAGITLLNLVRANLGKPHAWVGPIWVGLGTGYALLVRREVARRGSGTVLVFLTMALDLIAIPFEFVLITRMNPELIPVITPAAMTIAPLAMMLILHLHGLRHYPPVLIVGAFLGWGLTASLIVYFIGWNPGVIMVGIPFLLTGGIGLAASRDARLELETFARLNLLRRFLPITAVERVMRDHPDDAMALGGESVTVTILAADLRGFTAMSEKVFPAEIVRQLNAYHGVMLEEIDRHGGVLDKFIGDGTLAIFGLNPVKAERAADCGATAAVACAEAMVRAMARHNADRAALGQTELRMGIGVHTGPVIAGNIGAPERRLEFTVIGDAVNTASRLEGLTKEAQVPVIVSADTVSRLADPGRMRELPPMAVRGKEVAVRVFTV